MKFVEKNTMFDENLKHNDNKQLFNSSRIQEFKNSRIQELNSHIPSSTLTT
jgi:hypothetical protein